MEMKRKTTAGSRGEFQSNFAENVATSMGWDAETGLKEPRIGKWRSSTN